MISRLQFQGERYRRKKYTLANSLSYFDGINDYVDLQFPIKLSPFNNFGISLIFSIDGFQNNNVNHILSQYDSIGGITGFYIDVIDNGKLLRIGYANQGQYDFIETVIEYHKYYVLYTSYISGVLNVYLNGIHLGTITSSEKFGVAGVSILLGATHNNGGISNFFKGFLGAVKLFQSPPENNYLRQCLTIDPYVLPPRFAVYCVGEWDLNGGSIGFDKGLKEIHDEKLVVEYDWTQASNANAIDKSLNGFDLEVREGYDTPSFVKVSGLSCIGVSNLAINPGFVVNLAARNYHLQETFSTISVVRANTNTSGNNSGLFYSFDDYLGNGSKGFNMGYSTNIFRVEGIDSLNPTSSYFLDDWKDLNDRKFIVVINVHGLSTAEYPSKTFINGVLAAESNENSAGEFKKINEINLLHRDDTTANSNKSHHLYYFSCIKGDITENVDRWQKTLEYLRSKFIQGIEWGIKNPNTLKTVTSQSRFSVAENLYNDSSEQFDYAKIEKKCAPGSSRAENCGFFRDLNLTVPVLPSTTNIVVSGSDEYRRMVKSYADTPYNQVEFTLSGESGGILHWSETEFRLLDASGNLIERIPAIVPPENGDVIQRINLKNAAKLEILNNSTLTTGAAGVTLIKEVIGSKVNHGLIYGKSNNEVEIKNDFYQVQERIPSYLEFLQQGDLETKYFTSGLLTNKIKTNNVGHAYLAFSYIPSKNFVGESTYLLEQFNNSDSEYAHWRILTSRNSVVIGFKSLGENNVSMSIPVTNEESSTGKPINIYIEANHIDSSQWKTYKNGVEITHVGNGIISFTPNQEIGYISLGGRWDFRNSVYGGKEEKLSYIAWLSDGLNNEEITFFSNNGFIDSNNEKINEELYCQVDRNNKMTTKEGNELIAINYPKIEQQEFRLDNVPLIKNGLRLDGSTNFLKINDFNPTAEKGYNHIIILKNDFINLPFESVHRLYQVNDLLGDKVDHGTLTNFSGKSTIRMRSSGNYSSGFDDYLFEEYTPESTTIYSFYNEVLQGDVRRTIKVNNSVLVTGKNIVESEVGEGDYSRFGESVLNLGAGFSRGSAVTQWQGHILFYGMLKGELSHQHYLEIWNNGSPRMPKKEWGYDWQVVANLNRPVDPNGTPKIENLAGFLNPGVQNFEILMEGYSNEQLDSSNPRYAFVNIDSLK